MKQSASKDGAQQPNPVLVAFFREVRRLSEEVTRRQEAEASQHCMSNAHTEGAL